MSANRAVRLDGAVGIWVSSSSSANRNVRLDVAVVTRNIKAYVRRALLPQGGRPRKDHRFPEISNRRSLLLRVVVPEKGGRDDRTGCRFLGGETPPPWADAGPARNGVAGVLSPPLGSCCVGAHNLDPSKLSHFSDISIRRSISMPKVESRSVERRDKHTSWAAVDTAGLISKARKVPMTKTRPPVKLEGRRVNAGGRNTVITVTMTATRPP